MADFRLRRRIAGHSARTVRNRQDAIRWRRRRARIDDDGFANWTVDGADLTAYWDWSYGDENNELSLAAITDPNGVIDAGPTLSFVRATTATAKDYDGILRSAESGEARFQGGRRVGNQLLQSNDFDTTWVTTRSSVAASSETDPDGGTDAWAFSEDGTAADSHRINQGTTGQPAGARHTASIYAKAVNRDWILLRMNDPGPASRNAWFNVSTGTVGTVHANFHSAGIEDVGNGWYRCWASMDTDTNPAVNWWIADADGSSTFDGLSQESLLIYGAQLENTSDQQDHAPSEYVATTTAVAAKWYASRRRTNFFVATDDLDNTSYWNNVQGSITATADTPPSAVSTETVWEKIANTTSAAHTWGQNLRTEGHPDVVNNARPGTFSCYVKAGSTYDSILFQCRSSGNHRRIGFNLTSLSQELVADAQFTDYGIEDAGNGWARVWVTYIPDADGQSWIMPNNGVSTTGIFAGDDTGILVCAPQWEYPPTQDGLNGDPTAFVANTGTTAPASSGFDTAVQADGLLMEESRTNLALQSEDITEQTTVWTLTNNEAAVADDAIAPDGTLTADQLVDDNSTGTGQVYVGQNVTVATSTDYVLSVYAKADQLDWLYLGIFNASIVANGYFDLTNGVTGTMSADIDDSGIDYVGNGWYRCWLLFGTDAADTSGNIRIGVAEADNDNVVAYDGTSSIHVWGMQLEAGNKVTSYIPTTTASVTRNDDAIDGNTPIPFYNDDASTLYAEIGSDGVFTTSEFFVSLSDNSTSDRIAILVSGTDDIRSIVGGSAGNNLDLSSTGDYLEPGEWAQAVVSYQTNDGAAYVDGNLIGTENDVASPVGIFTLDVGSNSLSANRLHRGFIRQIRYYAGRVTDDNLDLMTTNDGLRPELTRSLTD